MKSEFPFFLAFFGTSQRNDLKKFSRKSYAIQVNILKQKPRFPVLVYLEEAWAAKTNLEVLNRMKNQVSVLLVHFGDSGANFLVREMASKLSTRILERTIVFKDLEILERVISAWESGAQHRLISDAYGLAGNLVVLDCAATRYVIEPKHLPEVKAEPGWLIGFEIHSDGSHIQWPDVGFHIDLEGLRSRADEKFRNEAIRDHLHISQKLGAAIRKIREEYELKQSDFKELSERQIRRIENGESAPTYDTLQILSGYHEMKVEEYLDRLSSYRPET